MPDWLVEKGEEAGVAAVGEGDIPSWLQGTGEEPAAVMADIPSWLTEGLGEQEPVAEAGAAPDWLSEFDRMPQETPEPQAAAAIEPEPAAAPEEQPGLLPVKAEEPPARGAMAEPAVPASAKLESIPEGELFDEYRRRLQEDPNDHPNRLALARALRTSQELTSSLNQYETLLEASQLLQDVSDDLVSMVGDHPDVPRVRRLLGDAFMRSGMLQEALDAYRSALDQL
jgi:tetratricopeptide (TPR) repeat protein